MLTTLKHLGLLEISGPDAKKLLQGQLSCDMEKISHREACLAALCNRLGRVIALFRIFIWQEHYYLLMPKNIVPITLLSLQKYAVFYKACLQDVSDSIKCTGFIGDEATSTDYFSISIDSQRKILLSPHYLTQEDTENEWRLMDFKRGVPFIHPETSSRFLPHELNLHNLQAIDFEKGCYTGQEIIARMHYRGKLKTSLLNLQIVSTEKPLPGSEFVHPEDTKVYGTIVDSAHIAYNNYMIFLLTQKNNKL